MPLDRTIQELESRLPDLRHLVADGEIVLATSESAALLADELESLLNRADTVASRLRQLLLGGSLPSLSGAETVAVAAPVPAPAPPRPPEPVEPVMVASSESAAWSEMDDELARIMDIETGVADEADDIDGVELGKRKLDELRRKSRLPAASGKVEGLVDTEHELRDLENKLGITVSPEAQRAHVEELQALARQVIGDQKPIDELWRELGIDPNAPDEPLGGATVEEAPRNP